MKKILSLCLVLSLCISMFAGVIPTASAATGASYHYNMGRLQTGEWSDNGVSPEVLTDWNALGNLANFHKRTSDPFMFYGKDGNIELLWTSSSSDALRGYGVRGTAIKGEEGASYTLAIRVGEAGLYTLSARAADQITASKLNFYLAPTGVANPKAAQYYLGSSINDSEDIFSMTTWSYGNQYLPSGDYLLTVEIEQNNDGAKSCGYFAGFWLDRVADVPDSAVVFSVNVRNGFVGQEVGIDLTIDVNNRTIPISDLDALRVDSLTPSVATVREEDGRYYLFGVSAGTTTLRVSGCEQGKANSIDLSIPIKANDNRYFYNFFRAYYGPWSNSARLPEYFTDFGMETKGEPAGTIPRPFWDESSPWKFGGKSAGFKASVGSSFCAVGWSTTGSPGDWINMVIRVPESGVYRIGTLINTIVAGGCYRVYVSPVGTPEENQRNEEYYIGDVECADAVSKSGVVRLSNNVTLAAADYNVVYEFKRGAAVGNGGSLGGIYLKEIERDQFKLFAYDPEPIMETTDCVIPMTARYNGVEVDFSRVYVLSYSSEDTSVATARIERDGNGANLIVHGVAPGKTKITFSGVRNGIKALYTINVDIADKKRIRTVELTAPKYVLSAGESVQTALSGTCFDGTPIDFSSVDVYYENSNGAAVSIDRDGLVVGKEKGESQITVWVKQGENLINNSKPFAVGAYSGVNVDLIVPAELKSGAFTTLAAELWLDSGIKIDPSAYTVTYQVTSQTPENCVQINGTRLMARRLGNATVTATVTFDGTEYTASKTVRIVQELPETELNVVDVVLNFAKTELYLGEFTPADVGVRYDNGWFGSYDPANMKLTYNEEILRYENGCFTALSAGVTDVTIEANGMRKSQTITVFDETIASATVELDRALYPGTIAKVIVRGFGASGREIGSNHLSVSYLGTDRNVASVDITGVVTANGAGETTILVTVSIGTNVVEVVLPVTVLSDGVESIRLTASKTAMKPNDTTGVQLSVSTVSALGVVSPVDVKNVTFESLNTDVLSVDANGKVLPQGIDGRGVVRATYSTNGIVKSEEIEIFVKSGKTESTYFTAERRAAVQENVANYDWAKASYADAQEKANKWVGREDELLEFITTQELPRGIWATYRYDPEYMICKYCGEDAISTTGAFYPWTIDNETNPWKVQCPLCQRVFPSNDFKAFYDTGIDENGNWSYELAKKNGSHLLTNDLYPEKGEGWGVDDGYGYKTGKTFATSYGVWDETYTWIAYWNHWGSWSGVDPIFGTTCRAAVDLAYGYVYTGNKEYGRTLAILIDRVADVYPALDTGVYEPHYYNSGWYGGRATGGIWETALAGQLATVYDAAFDMYDDPYVMEYIQNRAAELGVKTPKNSPEEVRQHIEDHLLREIFTGIQDKRIWGNEGMHQDTAVMTAVCLDSMPESKDWIDWATTGAEGVLNRMINTVDREGQGDENSPQYNNLWVGSYANMARWLGGYRNYPEANFYTNPKYNKMLKMNLPLTMTRNHTLQIGDTGGFATLTWAFGPVYMGEALANGSNDAELAQFLYFLNGDSAKGVNGTSLMVSGKLLEDKIRTLVEEYGEYDFDKSTQMPAYGAAILRDGTLDKETGTDTQHAVSLWYGSTAGHSGADTLSITLSAYGLDFMPAFGYPSNTSGAGSIVNWERATISKNTVQVNGKKQKISDSRTIDKIGDPIHFDDSEMVKVADGRNNWVYKDEGVEEYRRTEVMVEVGDGDSYTVDFFRIKGGYEHVYSFHGNSNEIYDYDKEALKPTRQAMGTYAGPNVPYGPGEIVSGYDGLYDVHRTIYPESKSFWVDLKIDDFRNVLPGERDLHLRMTQVNDFALSDVSFASGRPPIPHNNPQEIKYVLAKRTGTNLDSLFTTILEPYDTNRFIKSIDPVKAVRIAGNGKDDQVKAVKVTLEDGRVDYIVYAANNKLRYRIDDKFDFMGFIGVISYRKDRVVYRYVHDGKLIDTLSGDAQATGYVVDFTKDLAFENDIKVRLAQNIPASELVGKTVNVKNGGGNHTGKRNGSFWIRDAEKNLDGTYTLHLGNTTLITATDGRTYTYGIAENQSLTIPLTSEWMSTDVGVETVNGAQVRIRGVQGLRFISSIDKADPNFARAVEFGTVLIPSEDLTDISQLQIGATLNGHKVAKVPAKNIYAETENTITFTAVLTGLTEQLYTKEFTARAYAIMDDGRIIYADQGASRSIYSVAKRAIIEGKESKGVLAVLRNIVALVDDLDDNDAPDPWN
ncbi:MAG: heparinase II/III family protein [Oscillospiraceae bacterium]|nr:heparinase II/III family protein [Oscillospiraceae bacterium]